jgi:hypothetical protein
MPGACTFTSPLAGDGSTTLRVDPSRRLYLSLCVGEEHQKRANSSGLSRCWLVKSANMEAREIFPAPARRGDGCSHAPEVGKGMTLRHFAVLSFSYVALTP